MRSNSHSGSLSSHLRVNICGEGGVTSETVGEQWQDAQGFGHINPATFAKVLLGFVDFETLRNEPLFRELLRRLMPI